MAGWRRGPVGMRHALNAAENLGQEVATVMTTWPKFVASPTKFDELWEGHADAHGDIDFDNIGALDLREMYVALRAKEAYKTLPSSDAVRAQSFEWGARRLQGMLCGASRWPSARACHGLDGAMAAGKHGFGKTKRATQGSRF